MAKASRGEGDDEYQSRDQDGWLIRVDAATLKDLDKIFTIVVDGVRLRIRKARVATDAQGNPLKDENGELKVRATTLLDAIRSATGRGESFREAVADALGWTSATGDLQGFLERKFLVRAERGQEERFSKAVVEFSGKPENRDFATLVAAALRKRFAPLPPEHDAEFEGKPYPGGRVDFRDQPSREIEFLTAKRILFPPTVDRDIPRVPVLCHQDHLNPVAMCRVCAVRIATEKRGRMTLGRSLVPACQYRVEHGIPVFTMWAAEDESWEWASSPKTSYETAIAPLKAEAPEVRLAVRRNVQTLAEMLMAQCYHPEKGSNDVERHQRYHNELDDLKSTLVANSEVFPDSPSLPNGQHGVMTRFSLGSAAQNVVWPPRPEDGQRLPPIETDGSPFLVDFDNCILCDRCIRSCRDVREFVVLGRSGKGSGTHIAFDLDGLAMYDSSCHSCGECMKSCPTGAIVFTNPVLPLERNDGKPPSKATKAWIEEKRRKRAVEVEVEELRRHPRFQKMSKAFLAWNKGAVRRRQLEPGDEVACEGEFGNVAFILEGELADGRKGAKIGIFRRMDGMTRCPQLEGDMKVWQEIQDRAWRKFGRLVFVMDPSKERHRIMGEMSPMTHDVRTASMVAVTSGTILEIDRNVLSELLRIPDIREELQKNYASQALNNFVLDARQNKQGERYEQLKESLFGPPDSHIKIPGPDGKPSGATLAGLEDKEIDSIFAFLTEFAQLVYLEKDDVICTIGNVADDFFFIYQGFVEIDTPKKLMCRGQGAFFGEFPAVGLAGKLRLEGLDEVPASESTDNWKPRRSGTIKALDSVELFRFPIAPFVKQLLKPANEKLLTKLMLRYEQMQSLWRPK